VTAYSNAIFKRPDHGLRGQSMANRILGSALFAALRFRAGALLGVVAVGFNLSKRRHVAVPGNWVRFAIHGSRGGRDMAITSSFAAPGFPLSSPRTSEEAWSGWVSIHSLPARLMGSRPAFAHQYDSLPVRYSLRWCARHSGTVNSSLTLRLRPRDCANRR
jgi:hypothetical protein